MKEYGKGYSSQNLKYMSKFASEFKIEEIRLQPVTQIPWGTLITIIVPKFKSHEEILYYPKNISFLKKFFYNFIIFFLLFI